MLLCRHSKMKIYLDVCCLNRPFDDQSQDRVHMETEAIEAILNHIDSRRWTWIGSDVLVVEINHMPDEERKADVVRLMDGISRMIEVTAGLENRAHQLEGFGLDAMDALHVACAEEGRADVLLTTDDRLERICRKHQAELRVRVANPWKWLAEVLGP